MVRWTNEVVFCVLAVDGDQIHCRCCSNGFVGVKESEELENRVFRRRQEFFVMLKTVLAETVPSGFVGKSRGGCNVIML